MLSILYNFFLEVDLKVSSKYFVSQFKVDERGQLDGLGSNPAPLGERL